MKSNQILAFCALAAVCISGRVASAQQPTTTANTISPTSSSLIRTGQSVAFLGASISEYGWNSPSGYIKLVFNNLTENGLNIVPVPAGVSGNTSRDMLGRLERDVISKKPDWVTIDAGGNDVWHGSVDFSEYMKNMTAIVDKAQAAGIRVIIQTCTPIGEDQNNEFNPKLNYYNDFLRYLARQKGCLLADLNADSVKLIKTKTTPDNLLTVDGVHMNNRGNKVMAMGLLKTMGLTDDQITKTIFIPDETKKLKIQSVSASSMEDEAHGSKYAIDDNQNTRWASLNTDDQWLDVDLGTPQKIGAVVLGWEDAYGKEYKIQVSDDKQNWREVAHVTGGKGGDERRSFPVTTARYVRLQGLQRATTYGYSLWEISVYPPDSK